MAVPNIFANATSSIPLSQLDQNFATAITLGNTAVYLGNTTTTLGNLTLTNATVSSVSTPITPAQGGTGLSTLTANNVLIGNGTSNVTFVAPGTSGNVLTSNGTTWASQAASAGTSIVNGTSNVSVNSSGGNITVATAGTTAMTIDTSQNVGIGTSSPESIANFTFLSVGGSTSTKGVVQTYDGTVKTALYSNGTSVGTVGTRTNHPLTFVINGSETARIDTSGNMGIATTTTTKARLNIATDGTNTSAGYGVALTNTAGGGSTWTLQCGDQGVNNAAFTIRETGISGTTYFKLTSGSGAVTAIGVYNTTSGSGANVYVDSNGILYRSTSSLKYKKNIQDATHGLADVLKLRTVTYEGKAEADAGKTFGGLIAEEVHEAGLTEFVQYADDGTPDALNYGNMVSLAFKAIQELNAKVEAQAAEIAALKGAK